MWIWIVLGVIGAIVLLVLIWSVATYNNLVKGRNKVKNAFSQIDVQLKKRFDLIPNLVETVKGYAAHEKDILDEFAKARQQFQAASKNNDIEGLNQANNSFGSVLSRLLVVQEQYPELKADKHFQEMMTSLKEIESQIGFARQFYNDTVNKFNNSIEVFPASLIANMFNFKEETYFKATEEEKENVKVKFN